MKQLNYGIDDLGNVNFPTCARKLSPISALYSGEELFPDPESVDYPAQRLFHSAEIAVILYYHIYRTLVIDELDSKPHQQWLARLVVEGRTAAVIMSLGKPNIYVLDDMALRLWPGQPYVTGGTSIETQTPLVAAYHRIDSVCRMVFRCHESHKDIPRDYAHANYGDLLDIVSKMATDANCVRRAKLFHRLMNGKPDISEVARVATEHRFIIQRLRQLYCLDTFGGRYIGSTFDRATTSALSGTANRNHDNNGKWGLFTVDDDRMEILWDHEPIKGINKNADFRAMRELCKKPGGVVDYQRFHGVIKPKDPTVLNGSARWTAATPECKSTKGHLNKALRNARLPVDIHFCRSEGYYLRNLSTVAQKEPS